MILIKDVEIQLVPDQKLVELRSYDDRACSFISADERAARELSLKREFVRGTFIKNAKGEYVCFGMSKKVEEAIGLPMHAFINLQEQNKLLTDQLFDCRDRVLELVAKVNEHELWYDNVSWWELLKMSLSRLKSSILKQLGRA